MKKWYQSKTVIVNLLTAFVAVAVAFQGTDFIAANPSLVATISALVSGVNVALRFVTALPIGSAE